MIDKRRPVSVWIGEDVLDSKRVKEMTVILRTAGCRWRRCKMCGFFHEGCPTTHDELISQLKYAMERDEAEIVKIFTSGSFFDTHEIPTVTRDELIKILRETGIKKLIVESRPEFITHENLSSCTDIKNIEVGIGVETSNDRIRDECINKGFTFDDFIDATEIVRECGADVKAYLLLKPPFLSEKDAIEDAIRSAKDISPYVSTISLNPCNVQNFTILYELWKDGKYRPPWLWSVVETLKTIKKEVKTRVISDPVGAGHPRGPHNCGSCDRRIADVIKEFSLAQDLHLLDRILCRFGEAECDCRYTWEKVIQLEDFTFGSILIY